MGPLLAVLVVAAVLAWPVVNRRSKKPRTNKEPSAADAWEEGYWAAFQGTPTVNPYTNPDAALAAAARHWGAVFGAVRGRSMLTPSEFIGANDLDPDGRLGAAVDHMWQIYSREKKIWR